jgi:hypothetical protein
VILTAGMAHPRKLIRQAVVALLIAANTAAGARVLGTRVVPHKKSGLPALSVYTLSDPVDEDVSTGTEETHELELEIAGWVAHTDALPADDAMDDLAEQVEAAMRSDPFLGGKASKVTFKGTVLEVVEDDGRSDPIVGIAVLTYSVTYRADLTAPAPLDDFLSVDAKHRIVGAVEANQASDEFIVQETPP